MTLPRIWELADGRRDSPTITTTTTTKPIRGFSVLWSYWGQSPIRSAYVLAGLSWSRLPRSSVARKDKAESWIKTRNAMAKRKRVNCDNEGRVERGGE